MDTTTPTTGLTAAQVIDAVREARHDEHAAALRQLHLAHHWALIHPCRDNQHPAGWEDDHGLYPDNTGQPLAGPGTPLVDEYAPASFAAALEVSLEAGKQHIADALE